MEVKKLVTVVIPAFNEAANIPVAREKVQQLFDTKLPNYRCEILFTDNRSTDDSWAIISKLSKEFSNVRGLRFSRNFGYQNSIFAGLSLAKGDAVVELDCDLEDPPELIAEFVKQWEAGYDLVYGVRKTRREGFLLRSAFSLFYHLLDRFAEVPLPRQAGDCRLIDRKMLQVLTSLPERDLYLRGLSVYLGFKQIGIPYDRNLRAAGKSKFNFGRYFSFALSAITAFTKAPLRLIGFFGFFLFAVSLVLIGVYLVMYFRSGIPVQGFTTLVILTLFLHGLTLIFLGVLGEYLGRIFDDTKGRPRVIIAESTDLTIATPMVL